MNAATPSEIRALDALPVPGSADADARLRIAALALADQACEIAARLPVRPEILAFEGGGNNGADTRLAAERLRERGFCVRSIALSDAAAIAAPPEAFPRGALVLDGLLGIGFRPPLRPEAAAAISLLNRLRAERGAFILSVDLPSGMSAEGPLPDESGCVHANLTLTMGLPKPVFFEPGALAFTGEILVADIAYPEDALRERADGFTLTTAREVRSALPPRPWDSNKGSFGHVAIFAGSLDYPGAPSLAALGAARGGAGLVSVHVPASVAPSVSARAPELIVRSYAGPVLSMDALGELAPDLSGKVILAGPGLSQAPSIPESLAWILGHETARGFVLDADALNLLAPLPGSQSFRAGGIPTILTPHPGEAARLLGRTVAEVQADRPAAARELAERSGATVVLKGAGTLVAEPGRPLTLVPTGSPALAKGGSGDILAGFCAALLARGLAPYDAARVAVYRHGHAAFLAALSRSEDSFLPSDLLAEL